MYVKERRYSRYYGSRDFIGGEHAFPVPSMRINDFTEGELWLLLRQRRLDLVKIRTQLSISIQETVVKIERIDAPGFAAEDQARLKRKRKELMTKVRQDAIEMRKIDDRLAELDDAENILEEGL